MKRFTLLLFSLLGILLLRAQTVPNVEDPALKRALEEVIKGNGSSVAEELSMFLEKTESDPSSYNDIDYISAFSALCGVYQSQEQLQKVDSLIRNTAYFLRQNNIVTQYSRYLSQAYGLLHLSLNNYRDALANFSEAKQEYETKGVFDLEYAKCLNNMAVTHLSLKDTIMAKLELDYCMDIYQIAYPDLMKTDNPDVVQVLGNAGMLYATMGSCSKAIPYLQHVIEIGKGNLNYRSSYCLSAINLAGAFVKMGRYEDAVQTLNSIDVSLLDDRLMSYYLMNRYQALFFSGKRDECERASAEYIDFLKNRIFSAFSYFSGFEREGFWHECATEMTAAANMVANRFEDRQSLTSAYDMALFTKNLSLYSDRLLMEEAYNSNDPMALKLYSQMQDLKQYITYSTHLLPIDSLSGCYWKLHEIEKDLVARLPDFQKHLSDGFSSCNEVKAMLDKDDAAIEFVILVDVTPSSPATFAYGALVLTPDTDYPKLVRLCNQDSLSSIITATNRDNVNRLYTYSDSANSLYNLVWKPVDALVAGRRNIYISKTGLLNKFNFSAIPCSLRNRLSDTYQIIQVSSTANIRSLKNRKAYQCQDIALYGGIKYDVDTLALQEEAGKYEKHSIDYLFAMREEDEESRAGFRILPGTEQEVKTIAEILENQGKHRPASYLGVHANEESVKAMDGNSPEILHIATHGFYLSNDTRVSGNKYIQTLTPTTRKEMNMLYTGLLFAGANHSWAGNPPIEGVEDGIMTADEISRLDLSRTSLLVLSACETASGRIDAVDGVFGLQRGFKKAGVGTIVMSLWKVSDDATQLLMTHFYKELIRRTSSRQALQNAQDIVRKSYPEPYYWAAFIVLD